MEVSLAPLAPVVLPPTLLAGTIPGGQSIADVPLAPVVLLVPVASVAPDVAVAPEIVSAVEELPLVPVVPPVVSDAPDVPEALLESLAPLVLKLLSLGPGAVTMPEVTPDVPTASRWIVVVSLLLDAPLLPVAASPAPEVPVVPAANAMPELAINARK